MAVINEVNDTDIYMNVGDTYNGGVAGSDTRDVMIFNGLQAGNTYTVSIDLTSIADTVEVGILNLYAQGTRYFIINGVLAPASVPDAGFATFSPGELVGTTLTFNITVVQQQLMGLEFNVHNGGATNYSISLSNYVAPPAITEGADVILGDSDANLIDALGGDDVVNGAEGNDTVNGGAGNDTLTGGAGADLFVIDFENGADVITDFTPREDKIDLKAYGVSALESLTLTDTPDGVLIDLGTGNSITLSGLIIADLATSDFDLLPNLVTGTAGDDKVIGLSGVDIVTGGDGDDDVDGHDGNDSLDGGEGRDKLVGGSGDDTIIGGNGNDLLFGGDDNDLIYGGASNDRLFGDAGDDRLFGDAGNDKLDGGQGDDQISGGAGKDALTGGEGADVFLFEVGSGKDTITDFEDGFDQIDLSGLAAMGITEFGQFGVSQQGLNTMISFNGANNVLLLDVDAAQIDASDFLF